ncbi:MAG: T9SS type A sorting domain-containing protein [Flavobacteriales bacterium]|nr:T9SS type A sorting domain-containing protein [Flavobacteriales bacterium]
MRKLVLILFIFLNTTVFAQAPEIVWENTYQKNELCGAKIRDIAPTSDGGSVGVGDSCSDYYIVKIDSNGNKEWDTTFGGSGTEIAESINQTQDGGYIINGRTHSPNDGNVQGNHGGIDFWVVKLSSTGSFQWGKCFGSLYDDFGYDIIQTDDGNYLALGYLYPTSLTINGFGGADYWILKLSPNGTIIWQYTYGGNGDDKPVSFSQTSDGGFVVSGLTLSSSGQVTGNNGGLDAWIIKIDQNGTLQWQKNIGGSNNDLINMIKETSDGNYILVGATRSNDGDVSGNHGDNDIWVVKMNSLGDILWQKCYGGSLHDYSTSVIETSDGNFIVNGYTNSTDGDITSSFGSYDAWIIKFNDNGDIIWSKTLGSIESDYSRAIHTTSDNGLIVAGDRYIDSSFGSVGLVYKLSSDNLSISELNNNLISIYPNPSFDELNIKFNTNNYFINSITIVDALGKIVFKSSDSSSKIDISNFSDGIYYITITTESETFQTKFIKV